jgi:hypothetical protein
MKVREISIPRGQKFGKNIPKVGEVLWAGPYNTLCKLRFGEYM